MRSKPVRWFQSHTQNEWIKKINQLKTKTIKSRSNKAKNWLSEIDLTFICNLKFLPIYFFLLAINSFANDYAKCISNRRQNKTKTSNKIIQFVEIMVRMATATPIDREPIYLTSTNYVSKTHVPVRTKSASKNLLKIVPFTVINFINVIMFE